MTINDIIERNRKKCKCLEKNENLQYSCLGIGENYSCKYKENCYHQSKYENINICNYFSNIENDLRKEGKLKC